jgi:hypothetical protein
MIEQNTPEWMRARAGKITASRMCDVLAFGKRDGKPLKARADYVGDILAEILTGEPRENVRAKALDWGHDVEAAARAAYEVETAEIVELSGFVIHPERDFIGCSPDGLIGSAGMCQIKCPSNPAVHVATLRDGMPSEHIAQIQGELYVTGRGWSDFISYDPRMPEPHRLHIQRIERDEAFIADLDKACVSLWAEVQDALSFLNDRKAA